MVEHKIVNTKDTNNKDMVVIVHKPNSKHLRDAQIASSNAFKEAIKAGALLRAKLDEYMIEQGLWDENKEKELMDLAHKINEGERKLARGGAGGFTKSAAKQLALDMRKYRMKQAELLSKRRQLDEYTVEGQAENTRFDYLVSVCTKHEDGKSVFDDLENYRENSSHQYSVDAASALADMMYRFDSKWEDNLPENKFLKSQGFVDDKLRLINKDGKLVNVDGKLIDEGGRFINEDGKFIDRDGNLVDDNGNPIEEFVPFAEE